MNRAIQIIAAILIISAGISSVYTMEIAEEYSEIAEALVGLSAHTQYNIESVKSGYLDVNITFENPSKLPVHIYEVDYVFCIYNSSMDRFQRFGVSSGGGMHIKINPESNRTLWFAIPLEGNTIEERNETAKQIMYLYTHEKPFILNEYMEVYYKVGDYKEYVNEYTYGIPHYECARYGGGLFG